MSSALHRSRAVVLLSCLVAREVGCGDGSAREQPDAEDPSTYAAHTDASAATAASAKAATTASAAANANPGGGAGDSPDATLDEGAAFLRQEAGIAPEFEPAEGGRSSLVDATDASRKSEMPATAAGGGGADADCSDATDGGADAAIVRTETSCDGNSNAICDGSNPCKLGEVNAACACEYTPAADGTSCDDGDPCTESDRCVSGACVGSARTAKPAILGSVHSYGDALGLGTEVGFLSEDRLVFATKKKVSLVGRNHEGLKLLDRRDVSNPVWSDTVSGLDGAMRPRTWIIPVLDHRFALIGPWDIELFDTSQDKLTASQWHTFERSSEDLPRGAAGRGNRIWTCRSGAVFAFSISSTNYTLRYDSSLLLPDGHSCEWLALSDDSRTLYAATLGGLDTIDVSNTDGSMSLGTTALPGKKLVDVEAAGGFVGVFELVHTDSGWGNVHILEADGLGLVESFLEDLNGETPFGFAFAAGGMVLERAKKAGTHGCASYLAEYYGLTKSAATRLSHSSVFEGCWSVDEPAHMTGSGITAVLEPAHQVVAVDGATGSLTPVPGIEQGSFEQVIATGPSSVEAHGGVSMQSVRIALPSAPTIEQGGLITSVATEPVQLEMPKAGLPSLFTFADDAMLHGPRSPVSLLWPNAQGLPDVAGSVAGEENPNDVWMAAGRYLYELTPTNCHDLHLRRYPLSSFTRGDRQSVTPVSHDSLAPTVPDGYDTVNALSAAVDANTGDIVAVESCAMYSDAGNHAGNVAVASRFTASGGTYSRAFSREIETSAIGTAISGDKVGVLTYNAMYVFGLSGDSSASLTFASSFAPGHLLAFDSRQVYLSVEEVTSTTKEWVFVLRTSDLSEVGRYPVEEPVYSIAKAGNNLVFGMRSTLSVASPGCGTD